MITLIALLAVGYVVGLTTMLHMMKRSPEGFEDETGFHFGRTEPVTAQVESAGVIEFVNEDERMAA